MSLSYCTTNALLCCPVRPLWAFQHIAQHNLQSLNQDKVLLYMIEEQLRKWESSFGHAMVQPWPQKQTKVSLLHCVQATGFWGKAFWPGRMHAVWQQSLHPLTDTLAGCWVSGDIFWQSHKMKPLLGAEMLKKPKVHFHETPETCYFLRVNIQGCIFFSWQLFFLS